jgi:UDPglucose--hexose-1-phosphate uridylyltransferase
VAELRTDWLTGRSVLVAENRALRPNEFASRSTSVVGKAERHVSLANCPFCAGNEFGTPPATYEKLDRHGRWQVRVVPNMYPALTPPVAPDVPNFVATAYESRSALQQTAPAIGTHEVIIESVNHIDRMAALSARELRDVLEAYAARLRHWQQQGRYHYGLVFKNQGPLAGASISHLHSQLIALPFVPPTVAAESARASEAYSRQRECPYCQLVAKEREAGERIVVSRDGLIAFCPFASWQPFEFWLMPIAHRPSFEQSTASEMDGISEVLHSLIRRLESIVPDAAYNLLLRTAPWINGCDGWSHWRMELLPRMNALAGLELATDIHINPLAPEHAALKLRTGQGR